MYEHCRCLDCWSCNCLMASSRVPCRNCAEMMLQQGGWCSTDKAMACVARHHVRSANVVALLLPTRCCMWA